MTVVTRIPTPRCGACNSLAVRPRKDGVYCQDCHANTPKDGKPRLASDTAELQITKSDSSLLASILKADKEKSKKK